MASQADFPGSARHGNRQSYPSRPLSETFPFQDAYNDLACGFLKCKSIKTQKVFFGFALKSGQFEAKVLFFGTVVTKITYFHRRGPYSSRAL